MTAGSLAGAAIVATVVAGCGTARTASPSAKAVDTWIAAIDDHDARRACAVEYDPPENCVRARQLLSAFEIHRAPQAELFSKGGAEHYELKVGGLPLNITARHSAGGWRVHPGDGGTTHPEIVIIR